MFRRHRSCLLLVCLALIATMAPSDIARGQVISAAHPHVVSADPADTTPHVNDGKVLAILPMGGRIYVGGTFTTVKNAGQSATLPRRGLFAVDPATNRIVESFVADFGVDPAVNRGVQSLAPSPDGRSLFVGGDFTGRQKLVRISAATGQVDPAFHAPFTTAVKDIAAAGDRLFVAGPFDKGLAAVRADNGTQIAEVDVAFTDPRQAQARVESIAVTPDGKTLVAGGNFTKVDGQTRWQVALVDVTPGRPASVIDWQTDRYDDRKDDSGDPLACAEAFDTHIKDMDMSPDGSYFVVVTTGGYTSRGPLCDTAARWETSARGSGLQPTWANYDGGDTYTGVAITGAAVYVSGHMRWLNNFFNKGSSTDALPGPGSVAREGIAALDPKSGLPLAWNPGRERGHGAEALVATADGLWVGSDTDHIGGRDFEGSPNKGEYHPKLSFFPLAGGAPAPNHHPHGLPGDLYSLGDSGFVKRSFDGTRLGATQPLQTSVNWSQARGAFAVGNQLYTGRGDGKLLRWTFDGATLGQPTEVNFRGLTATHFPVKDVTGMFYDSGRLYYTRAGDRKLYYRAFLSGSDVSEDVIGDQTFVASDGTGGPDWSKVAGMTMAGGKIYWSEGGDLKQINFADGRPNGAPSTVASDAGSDGRGLFLISQATAPPEPPAGALPGPIPGPDATTTGRSGYWMVGSDGRVFAFGDAVHLGDAAAALTGAQAVDLEPTPSFQGYWVVDETGRVFGFGDARHHGNADAARLTRGETVTSLSATRSGAGYWLFTSKGRALALGDARHFGDMSAVTLNGPVLDSIPTPSGNGYYMVASDGGIFAFGDARFHGSMGDKRLNAPVQSLVPDPDSTGYWLVASDGGVFAFTAPFRGSMGATRLNKPMTGMVPFGNGYLMVAEDGGIFNFSDKAFFGSLGANPPARPIVSVAALDG